MKEPEYGTLIECIVEYDEDSGIQGLFAAGSSRLFGKIHVCSFKDEHDGTLSELAGLAAKWRYPGRTRWNK